MFAIFAIRFPTSNFPKIRIDLARAEQDRGREEDANEDGTLKFSSAARAQAVQWTRPYLESLCSDIRAALENWAGEPDRNAPDLEHARACARRLRATLAMLEIPGAAALAGALTEAMETLDRPDAGIATVLLETVAVLPDYLERLETGDDHWGTVLAD